jgi:hypothetical protein
MQLVRTAGIRASDADRERCAEALRHHYAAGRLDAGELEARAERAQAAATRAELALLLRDLPGDRGRRLAARIDRLDRLALKAHAAGFATLNGGMVGVWELTGGGAFWPAWTLVPTSMVLAWHAGSSWAVRRFVRRRGGRVRA